MCYRRIPIKLPVLEWFGKVSWSIKTRDNFNRTNDNNCRRFYDNMQKKRNTIQCPATHSGAWKYFRIVTPRPLLHLNPPFWHHRFPQRCHPWKYFRVVTPPPAPSHRSSVSTSTSLTTSSFPASRRLHSSTCSHTDSFSFSHTREIRISWTRFCPRQL